MSKQWPCALAGVGKLAGGKCSGPIEWQPIHTGEELPFCEKHGQQVTRFLDQMEGNK